MARNGSSSCSDCIQLFHLRNLNVLQYLPHAMLTSYSAKIQTATVLQPNHCADVLSAKFLFIKSAHWSISSNIVSIQSGFSIGGFDAYKIKGNVELGVGTADDEFEAIGRGMLNVEGLPLYLDSIGGIGTPTSDNERTKISVEMRNLLMIINGYSGNNVCLVCRQN